MSQYKNQLYGINKILQKYPNTPVDSRISNFESGEIVGTIKPDKTLLSLRKAAQVHREMRSYLQPLIKPGMNLNKIVNNFEETIKKKLNYKGMNQGLGFPCTVSINNCAAHWSTNKLENKQVTKNDIIKFDFGTEVNGWIIDSAFSVAFDPKFEPLLESSKEGTETGIKNAGIDVRLGEWGEKIMEVMESYQIELDNKVYDIKSVKNLGGHNIKYAEIHGGQFLPCFNFKRNDKMKKGIYAIETFATTGTGIVQEDYPNNSLFKLNNINDNLIKLPKARKLYNHLKKKFNTLPFSSRYISDNNKLKYLTIINAINSYPPLYDSKNSFSSQYEHTVYIQENGKEIISRGVDY